MRTDKGQFDEVLRRVLKKASAEDRKNKSDKMKV